MSDEMPLFAEELESLPLVDLACTTCGFRHEKKLTCEEIAAFHGRNRRKFAETDWG